MGKENDRRLKRAAFSVGLSPTKFDLIAFYRKLPDDAVLVGVNYDHVDGCSFFLFCSEEWEIVPQGSTVPYLHPWVSVTESIEARYPSSADYPKEIPPEMPSVAHDWYSEVLKKAQEEAACTCDLKYTGSKQHKQNCPAKIKPS